MTDPEKLAEVHAVRNELARVLPDAVLWDVPLGIDAYAGVDGLTRCSSWVSDECEIHLGASFFTKWREGRMGVLLHEYAHVELWREGIRNDTPCHVHLHELVANQRVIDHRYDLKLGSAEKWEVSQQFMLARRNVATLCPSVNLDNFPPFVYHLDEEGW